jgi:hypothetical protein
MQPAEEGRMGCEDMHHRCRYCCVGSCYAARDAVSFITSRRTLAPRSQLLTVRRHGPELTARTTMLPAQLRQRPSGTSLRANPACCRSGRGVRPCLRWRHDTAALDATRAHRLRCAAGQEEPGEMPRACDAVPRAWQGAAAARRQSLRGPVSCSLGARAHATPVRPASAVATCRPSAACAAQSRSKPKPNTPSPPRRQGERGQRAASGTCRP